MPSAAAFVAALRSVAWAARKDVSRYALRGVHLSQKDGKTVFVATDGKRLAREETDAFLEADTTTGVVAPLWLIDALEARACGGTGLLRAAVTKDGIEVEYGEEWLACTAVPGVFPPVDDVLPKDRDLVEMTVFATTKDLSAFRTAVKARSVVRLQADLSGLLVWSGEDGVQIPTAPSSPDVLSAWYQVGYLREHIAGLKAPLTLSMVKTTQALVVKTPAGGIRLLMPVDHE